MKKLLLIMVLLLCLAGCGTTKEESSKETEETSANETSEIAAMIEEGFSVNASSFDETEWRGLFENEDEHYVVIAEMDADLYAKADEVFFEDDKYLEFIKTLEIKEKRDVSDKLPGEEELQRYVGMTFGELEEEGFEKNGYCESDNYQYNFYYSNDTICLTVKSDAETPITNMDDFSENDIRELKVAEVVDCYLSSNIIHAD